MKRFGFAVGGLLLILALSSLQGRDKFRSTADRTVVVTWEPGPGWPQDLLDVNPHIELPILINSRAHDPSVTVWPIWTSITAVPGSVTTNYPIVVEGDWQAMVQSGYALFAGDGGMHYWKVSWNGAVGPRVSWDEYSTTIPIVVTVSYVPGGPPA